MDFDGDLTSRQTWEQRHDSKVPTSNSSEREKHHHYDGKHYTTEHHLEQHEHYIAHTTLGVVTDKVFFDVSIDN